MRESELENIKTTIDESLEMVKTLDGISIVCGDFIDVTRDRLCCCPLTACLIGTGYASPEEVRGMQFNQDIEELIAEATNFPLGFIAGFVDGFDARRREIDYSQYEPSYHNYYRVGYDQGSIYRKKLKPVDSMEVRARYCADCNSELNAAEQGREFCFACEVE